jgi:hypothetical protein
MSFAKAKDNGQADFGLKCEPAKVKQERALSKKRQLTLPGVKARYAYNHPINTNGY